MASSEEEMSSCSRSLALCFAKISCCNRRSCCCRKSNAATQARKGEVYENGAGFSFYKYDRRPHNENAPGYDNDDAITWQDFASHLDHCCFVMFFSIIILASLVLFIIWGIEYEKFSIWKKINFHCFIQICKLIFVVHLYHNLIHHIIPMDIFGVYG